MKESVAGSVKEGQRDTYLARRKGELRWAWNTHCDFHNGTRKQRGILMQVPLCSWMGHWPSTSSSQKDALWGTGGFPWCSLWLILYPVLTMLSVLPGLNFINLFYWNRNWAVFLSFFFSLFCISLFTESLSQVSTISVSEENKVSQENTIVNSSWASWRLMYLSNPSLK